MYSRKLSLMKNLSDLGVMVVALDVAKDRLTSIQPERAQSVAPVTPMGLRAPRLIWCSASLRCTSASAPPLLPPPMQKEVAE